MLCVHGYCHLIWDLDIPPRVKAFLWRLCRDCLPTNANIRTRWVNSPSICPLCELNVDTTFHTFFPCPIKDGCWEHVEMKEAIEACSI